MTSEARPVEERARTLDGRIPVDVGELSVFVPSVETKKGCPPVFLYEVRLGPRRWVLRRSWEDFLSFYKEVSVKYSLEVDSMGSPPSRGCCHSPFKSDMMRRGYLERFFQHGLESVRFLRSDELDIFLVIQIHLRQPLEEQEEVRKPSLVAAGAPPRLPSEAVERRRNSPVAPDLTKGVAEAMNSVGVHVGLPMTSQLPPATSASGVRISQDKGSGCYAALHDTPVDVEPVVPSVEGADQEIEMMNMSKDVQNEVEEARRVVCKGRTFHKWTRYGNSQLRKVTVSDDGHLLFWQDLYQKSRPKSMKLKDVQFVLLGQKTEVLLKADPKDDACCFSLITSSRTLDLQAESTAERDEWVWAFRILQDRYKWGQGGQAGVFDDALGLKDVSQLPKEAQEALERTTTTTGEPPATPRTRLAGLRDDVNTLQGGAVFLKHGRHGKPHLKQVWLSNDLKNVHWRDVKGKDPGSRLPVSEIKEVAGGRRTDVLRRSGRLEKDHLYFSLVCMDRTLDLECETLAQRDQWIHLFERLLLEAMPFNAAYAYSDRS